MIKVDRSMSKSKHKNIVNIQNILRYERFGEQGAWEEPEWEKCLVVTAWNIALNPKGLVREPGNSDRVKSPDCLVKRHRGHVVTETFPQSSAMVDKSVGGTF